MTGRRRDAVACALSTVGLVLATWRLPYRFPPSHFIAGASFDVGFNNSVSFLCYVALLPLAVVFLARALPSYLLVGETKPARLGAMRSRWVFGAVALFHVLLFGGLYAYKGKFVFSEALYFQTLIYRMTLGEVPYRDFSFYYGPSMLYPPYWLTKIMSIEAAYGLTFVATYVAGLACLWRVLGTFLPSQRVPWFLLLSLGLINPWTGLNVTFVRYLLPSLVFVEVHDYLRQGRGKRFGVAALVLFVALTYSFEVAVLSLFATLALTINEAGEQPLKRLLRWLAPLLRSEEATSSEELTETPAPAQVVGRAGLLVAVAVAATLTLFLALDPSGTSLKTYPDIASSYSAGAHNMPLYPNLPFLTLVATTLFAVAVSLRLLVRGGTAASFVLAYTPLVLLTQRGAFGVAEPSHIAFYELPALLLCLFLTRVLTRASAARRWLVATVLLGAVLPMQYFHVTQFLPFFMGHRAVASAAVDGHRPPVPPSIEATLGDVVRAVGTDRPYVMYELDYYSFSVYRRFRLRYPMYYTMLINARTPEGLERVIREVRQSRAIVVARSSDLANEPSLRLSEGVKPWVDLLTGAHTDGSRLTAVLVANRARLEAPFLDFVRREYRPLYQENGIVALGPKDQ